MDESRLQDAGREAFACSPGPASEPMKEAPLADTIVTPHGDEFPADCCDNCSGRRAEAVALRTRARLLEEACVADEPREMVAFHALLLVGMLRARGMA